MVRFFLITILPLILPTLLYILFNYVRHIGSRHTSSWWLSIPWFTLGISGCGLVIVFLITIVLLGGHPIEGSYEPAKMLDGRIVPGRTVPTVP